MRCATDCSLSLYDARWVQECLQEVANIVSTAMVLNRGCADDYEESRGPIFFAKSIVERLAGNSADEDTLKPSSRKDPVLALLRLTSDPSELLIVAYPRSCPNSCTATPT